MLKNPEFHARCLSLDWAYDALCTSTNLQRCQNGSLSQPHLETSSSYRKSGSSITTECPRCQGIVEIPVLDTAEWAIFAEEYRCNKAQDPIARPLRHPPQSVEMKVCSICDGYKLIDKRELDEVMKVITSDGFSNETSILKDQELLLYQANERERREAQNERSPPPPQRSEFPRSSEHRLDGATASVLAKSLVLEEPQRDIRE